MAFDFADIASRYLDRRIDQATQPFTDPEAYMNRRLGLGDESANVTPRSTTISYNDDGTQTITNKMEMGPPAANAPQPFEPFPGAAQYALPQFGAAPQPMAQPQPMAAQPVAQPVVDPAEEERKRREAALQQQQAAMQAQPQAVQLQAPAPAPQVGPTPEPAAPAAPVAPQAMAQPQPAAAAPAAPPAPVSPQQVAAPAMPPMPQPGPGTQLAGPMVAGAVPQAQPAAAAPASTQPLAPLWQTELLNAKDDVGVYHAVAGNKAYPAEIRSLAGELAANLHKGTIDATKAEKLVKDALSGDPKAANTLAADLRKRNTEEGSYIKAYLFSRLGLNDLAREEQEKLSTKKTLGQASADGREYTTEVDKRTGQILRAWDASGARQGEDVVAKLQAGGYKPGTQAFSSTGDIHITPDGQQQVVKRFNSITGKIDWVDVKTGEAWKGQGTPSPQRISTNAQIALNQKLIDFAANPSIAGATEAMKLATAADPGDGSEIRKAQALINKTPFANQVPGVGIPAAAMPPGAPSAQQVTPGAPGAPAQQVTPPAAVSPAAVATPPAPQVGAGVSGRRPGESFDSYQKRLALEKTASEAAIQKKKELEIAREKPPEEAKGKITAKDINNQNFANETYGLIRPVAELVKKSTGSGIGAKVDVLASQFGKGTEGAAAIAQLEPLVYPILANVPRFEGPQSDYDVKTYMKAAGDFANPEKPVATRLAALQGMITLLKKYDKEGKNDWTFGAAETTTVKPYDDAEKERRYQEYLKKRNAGR